MCAGYEAGQWRSRQLAEHLVEWLPEFVLKHSEREALGAHNAVRQVIQAARAIYTSSKPDGRGEIGEILLHAVLRQVYGTIPAISKFYYKDSSNDTVKGFDAVHVIATPDSLELWLGESKFYDDIKRAIRDVVGELKAHTKRDYLRGEFAAITNKIEDAWPHAAKLKKLLDKNTSLDEVFDAACIPVLLTYDSDTMASHQRISEEFVRQFEAEVFAHRDRFAANELPKNVRVHLVLFPMKAKVDLIRDFDERLKRLQ